MCDVMLCPQQLLNIRFFNPIRGVVDTVFDKPSLRTLTKTASILLISATVKNPTIASNVFGRERPLSKTIKAIVKFIFQ